MKLEQHNDLTTLLARVFMSSLFILYGYFKITAFAGTTGYMAGKGLPIPSLMAAIAVAVELGGGLLILIGYQTRLVALILAIYVVLSALIAHRALGDPGQLNHFFKNMAITGGFLALMASGAGRYSLDARNS